MAAVLGYLLNPKTAPIVIGAILLLVGFGALAFGNVPFALVAFGFAMLIFTAAEVQFWEFTVPAGVVLIVAGILWGTISAYLRLGT